MSDTTAAVVGANIAAARERAGKQQTALAELLGVGSPALSQWESGNSLVPLKRLIQIAGVLDIPLVQLFKGLGPASGSYRAGYDAGWRACAARAARATEHVRQPDGQ